jgi:C4-dicarboxylate transporter, DctQ subunit
MIYAFIKKILKLINILETTSCYIGMWLCAILTFMGVINRYILNFPAMWIDDLAVYIFTFYLFISIALTTREDSHLKITVFQNKFFKKNSTVSIFYSIFLRGLTFFILIFFIPPTYNFFIRAVKYPEYGTLVRWFNTSWLAYMLFFMVMLLLIHTLQWIVKDIILIKESKNKLM